VGAVDKVKYHLHIGLFCVVHCLNSFNYDVLSYCCCERFDKNGKEKRQECASLSGALMQCETL